MNFNTELKIGMCRCVERCFPTKLPPECRSERDTPVGVLVDQNGDRRKKLSAVRCSDDGCGFCEAS